MLPVRSRKDINLDKDVNLDKDWPAIDEQPGTQMPPSTDSDAHTFRDAASTYPIDRDKLSVYLSSVGLSLDEDAPIEQFATGLANINYRLSIAGRLTVLRRPPAGDLPPGAHDMKREHHILSRLHRALPLAPESLHFCADKAILGAPFQIIEYHPGLVIKGDDQTLLKGKPERCARLGEMLVNTLAQIHQVDTSKIGLSDFGKPEGFIARAINGWRGRAERLETAKRTQTLTSEIGNWLSQQTIPDRLPTLLHCDFKLDNMILAPETFEPRAIVDWDMGTRGDPLFDLATLLSYWTEPGDPDCMQRLAQMPTTAPGFPTRNQVVDLYARKTGIDVSDFQPIRVLAIFKLAVVFLQLHALRGKGPDADPAYVSFDTLAQDLLQFTLDVAHS